MNYLSRLSLRQILLPTALLICLFAGCGYQSNSTSSASQKQQGSCPTEETMKNTGSNGVVYAVSWDAVATDADNNRGTSTLHVSALDVASGKVLWQKTPAKISAMYQSSLQQVVNGVLYIAAVGSQNTPVIAVDTRDGHAIWQYEEKQGGVSAMSICAGKVYLHSGTTDVKALRSSDGKVLWSYTENKGFLSQSIIVTTQAVYMVEYQQEGQASILVSVIALGADNGKVLWNKSYGKQQGLGLSLVANGQMVYVINQVKSRPSEDPTMPIASVQSLDAESGKVMWTTKMPPNMEQINVLKANGIIYLNGQNSLSPNQSILVALNVSDGRQLWQRNHSYDQITVLDKQNLYGYKGYAPGDAPQGKKLLCSLDNKTGKDRWCIDSLQPSLFSLSATQDTVIVEEVLQPSPLTLIQNIYGVSKQNGKILWKLPWKSSSASMQTLTLVTVMEKQNFTSLQA